MFFFISSNSWCSRPKGIKLCEVGRKARNIFWLSDDILPQVGRPTFMAIDRYKAYIFEYWKEQCL